MLTILTSLLLSTLSTGQDLSTGLSTGQVTMTCAPGVKASGAGDYGGVGFNLSCKSGKTSRVRLRDLTSTDFRIRVGAETAIGGVDCVFSGTAPSVQSCAGLVFVMFDAT